MEYKLGARGLRSITEAIMTDAMFELPSDDSVKEFKVTPVGPREILQEQDQHAQSGLSFY